MPVLLRFGSLKSPYNSLEDGRSFSFKDKIAQAQDTMIC